MNDGSQLGHARDGVSAIDGRIDRASAGRAIATSLAT